MMLEEKSVSFGGTSEKKLFHVRYNVRPAADHPRFEDFQYGFLHVWIFATDKFEAANVATEIVDHLPYKFAQECAHVFESTPERDKRDFEIAGANEARQIGIAFQFSAVVAGSPEIPEFYE